MIAVSTPLITTAFRSFFVFIMYSLFFFFFFSSRRRHTRYWRDWSSDVCSSDLDILDPVQPGNYAFAFARPSNDPGEDAAFSAVAGQFSLSPGVFYFGLSHDDVGGLRYLYNTNNIVTENLLPTVAAGTPFPGSSPWTPYFSSVTNAFVQSSNQYAYFVGGTGTNLIVRGLRPGVSKLHFQRVNFDSLIGSTFVTITNLYTDTTISNARPVIQPVQRVIRQPDILFVAADNGTAGGLIPITAARTGTTGWLNNDAINGVTGQ